MTYLTVQWNGRWCCWRFSFSFGRHLKQTEREKSFTKSKARVNDSVKKPFASIASVHLIVVVLKRLAYVCLLDLSKFDVEKIRNVPIVALEKSVMCSFISHRSVTYFLGDILDRRSSSLLA